MRITLLIAVAAVLGAVQDLSDRGSVPGASPELLRSGTALQVRPVDTPATQIALGDIAPDFSYQGVDARWRRLRDLAADAPVLLVFGANEGMLRILEGERDGLMDLGVLPVAVVSARIGAARALVNRHDLRFTVLADPQGVIASQFNTIDPEQGRVMASWFVLDSKRRVRGLGRNGLPLRGYTDLAARALGLPSRTAVMPAAR